MLEEGDQAHAWPDAGINAAMTLLLSFQMKRPLMLLAAQQLLLLPTGRSCGMILTQVGACDGDGATAEGVLAEEPAVVRPQPAAR